MKVGVQMIERAFQLARSGTVYTIGDIKVALHREGYRSNELVGPTLYKELRAIIRAARQPPPTCEG